MANEARPGDARGWRGGEGRPIRRSAKCAVRGSSQGQGATQVRLEARGDGKGRKGEERGEKPKTMAPKKELERRYLNLGRHKERLLEEKTDWDEQRQVGLEGLSREQRGVVFACYDRGGQGLPSLVGASRWLLAVSKRNDGQVTLGRADGKKVPVPLVPRNPTCASVAARHPLWGSTLSTTALWTAGHLWMPSSHSVTVGVWRALVGSGQIAS